MKSGRQYRGFLLVIMLLCSLQPLPAATATLSVDASTTVNTFIPAQVFGSNTAWGNFEADYLAIQPGLQAAGIRFLRYPGGSDGDRFHWNGTGSYINGIWVPDDTNYSRGFICAPINNGTSASGTSLITDGLTYTAWVSNADTDFPNAQWVYIDTGGAAVNQVQIQWGSPYAVSFKVQYWNGPSWPYPWKATSNLWVDTSAGTVAGTGGQQTVNFNSVTHDYIRILMTASSAGAGGAYSVAEVNLFNGATKITPGSTGATVSSTVPASVWASPINMDFEEFMDLCRSYNPPAEPIIILNFGTGSPQEAAAWVHYANIIKSYNIKYWEIGNELGGNWEIGGPLNSTDYARRFIEYYNAITTVDPTVKLLGPVYGPSDASENLNTDTYITDMSQRLISAGMGNALGGVSIHMYPGDGTDPVTLASPATWPASAASIAAGTSGISGASSLPVVMSEFNSDSSGSNISVRLVNALFLVDWLGQYIAAFGTRAWANQFAAIGGGNQSGSPMYCSTCGNLGMFDGSPSPYQFLPYASFYGMQLISADWAIANDSRTHTMVDCTSSTTTCLAGYADLRPDGHLSLIVVNKDPVNTYSTTVQIAGFNPQASANAYSYSSANYQWLTTTAQPYHASPNTPPTQAVFGGAGTNFSYNFPAYSIVVFDLAPSGSTPTFTPTLTPIPTVTYSPTTAPTACASLVCYNGETGAGNVSLSNGWTWCYAGTTATDSAAAAHSGARGLDLNFNFTSWVGLLDFGWTGIGSYNLTNYDTLEFWVQTASGVMNYMFVQLTDADSTSHSSPQVAVNTYLPGGISTTWQKVIMPLTAFTGIDMTKVIEINFYISGLNDANQDVYVDDVMFTKHCAAATPTLSRTFTNTPTQIPGSPTFTPTYSMTASSTPTNSYTASPTTTGSSTPPTTPTPSPSITETCTGTPPTSTNTATVTPTSSQVSSSTVSPSRTPTPSFTVSYTLTPVPFTPTVTATRTTLPATPTFTPTPNPLTLTPDIVVIYPNPYNPDTTDLYVLSGMTQNAKNITLRIYTDAFRLIRVVQIKGPVSGPMAVDKVNFRDISMGIYYMIISAEDPDNKINKSRPQILIILK
jgi:hypothetical protein